MHVNEGKLARSLLSSAIDDLDPDPANVAALLDGIDGAFERAQLGAKQAAAGDSIALEALEGVAQVELARAAVADLYRLVRTPSLPDDTRERVRSALEPLRDFPRPGPVLAGRWEGFRIILGPWRWMLLIDVFDETRDRVVIVTIQDARTSSAATGD